MTATASDDVGVQSVQFRVDGDNVGAADTQSPYSASWNTTTARTGRHTISAVARDAAGNTTTATNVTVTVDNVTNANGLVAAYGFEDSGTTTADDAGTGNTGTISGATRTAAATATALSFDGVNDWVSIPDAASLDLTTNMTLEAWVKPTALNAWQAVLIKEQLSGLTYGLYSNSDTNRPSARLHHARIRHPGHERPVHDRLDPPGRHL